MLKDHDYPEYSHYRRWYWGQDLDFTYHNGDEYKTFQPYYHLNDMNNHGEIAGYYATKEPQHVYETIACSGSIYGTTSLGRITNNFIKPIIIESNGTPSIKNLPPGIPQHSADSTFYEIKRNNDHGDYIIESRPKSIVYNGYFLGDNASMGRYLHEYKAGIYRDIQGPNSMRIVDGVRGSCLWYLQFSGTYLYPTQYNNQSLITGYGRRSDEWLTSPGRGGTSFRFAGSGANEVDYLTWDLNQNNQMIGRLGDSDYLFDGSSQYDIPSVIYTNYLRLTSPESNEALMVMSRNHLAVQKRDLKSGDLQSLSDGGNAYLVTSAEEILHAPNTTGEATKNAVWDSLNLFEISDNSYFIAGTANKNGVSHAVLLLKVDLVPDYNRDGAIDLKDRNKITDTNPHRWWLNDDDDISEVKGKDAPGDGSADYNNSAVDTARDLVDFFPVFIDLKSFLTGINDLSTITVKLKHADGSLKFVYTDLLPEDSRDYWYETGLTTGYGSSFTSAPGVADTIAITSSGVALSQAFLTKMKNDDKGVIMLEGAGSSSSTEPLVLEVSNSSGTLFEFEMPLELSPVTDMFRHVNLASHVGTSESDYPDTTGVPSNYPEALTNDKHFAFIHGYNVSQDESKGWNCELFKRMHQMGSRAKYIGVTWHGDTSPDYHNAVYNAFRTSEHVAAELGGFSNLTIAAHSLGNMVISNAMAQATQAFNPDRYYLMNAATPIEAYNASQAKTDNWSGTNMYERMTESDWKDYPDRLYASNWYDLFDEDPTDARGQLTWKNRFQPILGKGYNFFSPGEDIVENAGADETFFSGALTTIGSWWNSDDNGRHAWVLQEIGKGNTALRAAKLIGQVEEVQAGWDFNGNQNDLEQVGILKGIPVDSDSYRPRYASETSATEPKVPTDEQLAQFGFFSRFNEYSSKKLYAPIDDVNVLPRVTQTQAGASDLAAQNDNRWHLLAEAIPAMSFAAAANSVNGMQENYNMMADANGWPASRTSDPRFGSNWLHSDFKNVSLNYTRKTYEKMISIGGLDYE